MTEALLRLLIRTGDTLSTVVILAVAAYRANGARHKECTCSNTPAACIPSGTIMKGIRNRITNYHSLTRLCPCTPRAHAPTPPLRLHNKLRDACRRAEEVFNGLEARCHRSGVLEMEGSNAMDRLPSRCGTSDATQEQTINTVLQLVFDERSSLGHRHWAVR